MTFEEMILEDGYYLIKNWNMVDEIYYYSPDIIKGEDLICLINQ